VGTIVLIRQHGRYCALKVTNFEQGTGNRVWTAEYEAYSYEGDTSIESMQQLSVKVGKNDAYFREPWGIGHILTFTDTGRDYVICRPFTLQLSRDDGGAFVYFYNRILRPEHIGIELAPTTWKDVSEVNLFDKCLTWYRYDEKRKRFDVRLSDLCRAQSPKGTK